MSYGFCWSDVWVVLRSDPLLTSTMAFNTARTRIGASSGKIHLPAFISTSFCTIASNACRELSREVGVISGAGVGGSDELEGVYTQRTYLFSSVPGSMLSKISSSQEGGLGWLSSVIFPLVGLSFFLFDLLVYLQANVALTFLVGSSAANATAASRELSWRGGR